MGATKNMDLIGTIEDDAEVENLSEDSDAEVEVSALWKNTLFLVVLTIFFSLTRRIAVSTDKVAAQEGNWIRKGLRVRIFGEGI